MASGIDDLRKLEDTVVTVTSPDRTVTVEMGKGEVNIKIAPGSFEMHTEESMSRLISSAVQAAGSAMREDYRRLRQRIRHDG